VKTDAHLSDSNPEENKCLTENISPWIRWGLYLDAWSAVIVTVGVNNPNDLLSAAGFPIGLFGIVPNGQQLAITAAWLLGPICAGIGWTIYIVLTVVIGYAKRITIFSIVYAFFCVLLALNVVGCKRLIEAAAGTH